MLRHRSGAKRVVVDDIAVNRCLCFGRVYTMAEMPREMNQYGVTDDQYHVIKTEIDRMFAKREHCWTPILLSWIVGVATLVVGLALLVINTSAGLDSPIKIVGLVLALVGPTISFFVGRHYYKEEDKRIEKTISDLCIRITQVVFKGKSIRVTRETFKSGTAYVEGEFVEKSRRGQTIFLFEMAGVKVVPPPPPSLLKKIMDVPDLYADDPDHERRRTKNERGSLTEPGAVKITIVSGDDEKSAPKHISQTSLAGALGNTSANTGSTTKRAPPKPTAAVAFFFGLQQPKAGAGSIGSTASTVSGSSGGSTSTGASGASGTSSGAISPASSPPPLGRDKSHWVPDHEVANCEKCSKPFTLLLRRHHCRVCGHIFCGDCSSKQIEKERACDSCFTHHAKIIEAQETYRLQQALAAEDDEKAPPPPPVEEDDNNPSGPPLAAPVVVPAYDTGSPVLVNPLLMSLAPSKKPDGAASPTASSSPAVVFAGTAVPVNPDGSASATTPAPAPPGANAGGSVRAPPMPSAGVLATLHGRALSTKLSLPPIPGHKPLPSVSESPASATSSDGGGRPTPIATGGGGGLSVVTESEPDSPPPPPPGVTKSDVELRVSDPKSPTGTSSAISIRAASPKATSPTGGVMSTSPRASVMPPRPPSAMSAILGNTSPKGSGLALPFSSSPTNSAASASAAGAGAGGGVTAKGTRAARVTSDFRNALGNTRPEPDSPPPPPAPAQPDQ